MKLPSYIVNYARTKIPPQYGPLDKKGIPLFNLKYVRLRGNPVYHPTAIIQYGLAHHTLYQNGDAAAEEIFLKCAGWLEDNATWEPRKRFLAWYYPYRLRMPAISPPWISGMAQGQALSLLLRAYQQTASPQTAEVAWQAAKSFLYELQDGGILTQTTGGNMFVEELASAPAIHILNGCLYSLVGLYEYLSIFPDTQLQGVLRSCVSGIEEVLPNFDLGWWSRYSLGLHWNTASFHYHDVHISLLTYLGNILDLEIFRDYAFRWDGYRQSLVNHLRRRSIGFTENNWSRFLGVVKLNHLRYRKTINF